MSRPELPRVADGFVGPITDADRVRMYCCPHCGSDRITNQLHPPYLTYLCGFSQTRTSSPCEGTRFVAYVRPFIPEPQEP